MHQRVVLAAVLASLFLVPASLGQLTFTDPSLQASRLFFVPGATQMRFLGDDPNDFVVNDRTAGKLVRVRNRVPTTVLDLAVADTGGESGLIGFALHPQFASNGYAYVYYTASPFEKDFSTFGTSRLSRFSWDGSAFGNEVVLRTFVAVEDGPSYRPNHFGGPLVFGPDGKLYGVLGDSQGPAAEQNNRVRADVSSRVGGIFRLNAPGDATDGSVLADNPFASHANPDFRPWYAYGVRNSYGISFDPLTGRLWDTENGTNGMEEINLVAPGFNSGWTAIQGPDSRSPRGVGDLVHLPGSAYSDPELTFAGSIAPTDITFLAGTALGGQYEDAAIVGAYLNGRVYLMRLNAARDRFVNVPADLYVDSPQEIDRLLWATGANAAADFEVGPDRALYMVAGGSIYRIVPEPAAIGPLSLLAVIAMLRRSRRCVV